MADTNIPKLPRNSGQELGKSGTLIFHGFITAEEYNNRLLGKAGIKQYDIMRKSDSTVRAALQVVKLPLLATTWDLEPAADQEGNVSDADKEIAAFIKRELMDRRINWSSFLRQALTMLDFGHCLFEKVYEVTDYEGQVRIGLAKLGWRKQTTIFSWETLDEKPGITQQLLGTTVSIPREKLIVFTFDQEGDNYQGVSLLRYAFKDWDLKDKLTLVNAIALERLGTGIPKVTAKPSMTPTEADKAAARDALQNMRANEEAYIDEPETLLIEMLDMKGHTTKDIIPTLQFHKRGVYESILATFMDLGGSSGSGAKALASDLTGFFMKAEEAMANTIVGTLTNDLIQELCDLNFSDLPNGYPKLTFGSIGDDDLDKLATAVNGLMTAGGITPDPDLEDHLRTLYRFPLLPQDIRDNYANRPAPKGAPGSTPVPEADLKDLKDTKPTEASVVAEARKVKRKLIDIVNQE